MPKKVFELAKELDKGPLDLVEELKSHGINVRNHMASLSDDDVAKVLAIFKPKPSAQAVGTKKTTTRKRVKTIKKVDVAAAAGASSSSDEAPSESEDDKKTTVIIRKTKDDKGDSGLDIPRYSTKSTDEENADEKNDEEIQAEVSEDIIDSGNEVHTEAESATSGLRVVSRPELRKASAQPVTQDQGDNKVYLNEKIHRFTPVFIPEKKVEHTSQTTKPAAKSIPKTEIFDDDAEGTKGKAGTRDDLDSLSGKKRLGGLASMISGKKVTVTSRSQVLNEVKAEDELKIYSTLSGLGRPVYTPVKKKKSYFGPSDSTLLTEVKDSKRVIGIHKISRAGDLAQKLNHKFEEFADKALELNLLLRSEDILGLKLCQELAALYNYRVEDVAFNEEKALDKKVLTDEQKSNLPPRNPIITIMGHVDHGKTSLLDYIRKAKVAAGEAGGITQHIGAYSVKVNDKNLTFLDTPGHAAFANMRQRGANVTDIVVLVVAADDGAMPQTRESIGFCQEAKVPMIIAINKMDKEGANPERIKTQLTEYHITPEEWGGDTQYVPISALKGEGIDNLLEAIALQAEVMDLRADDRGNAEGIVIESKIEQGRGPVATILIQKGTLKKGDSIVVGETSGRARSLMGSAGENLNTAGPSVPVQILGLESVPNPGDILNVVKNEREAKKIIDNRIEQRKNAANTPEKKKVSLEDFFAGVSATDEKEKNLNLIIRTDVQGSYEAIKQSVEVLSNPEVSVRVIGGGVGAITDSDIQLAATTGAFVIGFNMRPVTSARKLAEDKGIDIKNYSVIYELINDVKLAMEGLLEPEFSEEFIGRAEVRETFDIPKIGMIAGSTVIDGKIAQGCKIRLLRNGKILHDGKLSSLKRFKDDVKEVKNGIECGIALENYTDVKVGDIFEAYLLIEKKRTLEDVVKANAAAEIRV